MSSSPSSSRCRAVIFDFDGLLADTEPLHYHSFAEVLAEEGIRITPEENNAKYMGLHDDAGFETAFQEAGRPLSKEKRRRLVERKAAYYRRGLKRIALFPGARELVGETGRRLPMTIASCGRRFDIEAVLQNHDLSSCFPWIVSAEDFVDSKPKPECFLKALERFRQEGVKDLEAEECIVFEDSHRGIEAARRAGMWCVAVAHSYPPQELEGADRVILRLSDWRWDSQAV